MTITVTWPMIGFITTLIGIWSGFLIGLIRWSLKRNLAAFEEKLAGTATQTAKATQDLAAHKVETQERISALSAKLKNIPTGCSSHLHMDARVDGHNDRLAQHKELIVKIEGEFKSLPKKRDLDAVHDQVNIVKSQIADVRTDVGKIAGALPGLTNITEMMNKFLLLHGGGK
jgi:hypothetical protein